MVRLVLGVDITSRPLLPRRSGSFVGRDVVGRRPYGHLMKTHELDDLVGGVPPRQVDSLTAVSGHNISNSNAHPAICECGQKAPANWARSPKEWRETHLAEAWPEVPRAHGESSETFLARLSKFYVAALMREQSIDDELGLNPVRSCRAEPIQWFLLSRWPRATSSKSSSTR